MGTRIRRGLKTKGFSEAEFAQALDLARQTVNNWMLDLSEPQPANLLAIADLLFDGDVHYLVRGSARPRPDFSEFPPEIREIMERPMKPRNLPPEYALIRVDTSAEDFTRKVTAYLAQGWELVGGARYVVTKKGGFWVQTVTRQQTIRVPA